MTVPTIVKSALMDCKTLTTNKLIYTTLTDVVS